MAKLISLQLRLKAAMVIVVLSDARTKLATLEIGYKKKEKKKTVNKYWC